MIRKEDLFNSIVSVEKKTGEKISFENAKKLIEKINEKIRNGMNRTEFTNLVVQVALGLELPYKYCKVAYIYYGKARTRKKTKV